ncbi:MAG: ATP-dependent RNA helicase DbpA [Pseudomonadales bacterium]|nr:ATP-dependent RNA helicase DbpA [Pseudomonadales bacterium]MBO6597223.1 ATP-dependent RNA helicase DbpA [Pseudomonadales bacterium]MBO6823591.1 ATP-dependent RNA helicase DbpA [Pseudomonadales bacterium]
MDQPLFSSLTLKPDLLHTLDTLGYTSMTPIQAVSLPDILQNRDVIGQARTGSGKTVAFGLGILQKLEVRRFRVQSLVLCPTRELSEQVATEIRRLARGTHNIKVLTLVGGVAFGPQKGSLEHGAHIIVGTPGRVEEHLRKRHLDLSHLTTLVLDEADRMLDMGFTEIIDKVTGHLPPKRQTLLFSATFPTDTEQLSKKVMTQPKRVSVDLAHSSASIHQLLYRIPDKKARMRALITVLLHHKPHSALIFCNTRQLTEEVTTALKERGFSAQALHGDLEQKEREIRLLSFANGSLSALVATDVAARGLDIETLDVVVNYHLSRDPEVHTHRIGRTGRAGSSGIACSLYHEDEQNKVELLEGMTGQTFERMPLPQISDDVRPAKPDMITLQIDGGKKQKIRPGDILGALTGKGGIEGKQVGKIKIFDLSSFVAIKSSSANKALKVLQEGKVKGRSFRARKLSGHR